MDTETLDKVDAVIIGAGIMGLSTAYYLSKMGLSILIVERESYVGGYTTLRCAGGIRQQFSSPVNILLSILNRQLIQEIEQDNHFNIPFNPCGYAFAFTKEDSVKQAENAVKMQREMSVNAEFLSRKDTIALFPNIRVDDVLMTTYCREDGLIDIGSLLGLLKRELDKRKVRILCETAVCAIETKGGHVSKVRLDKGEINTPNVINATGPWSAHIGAMLDLAIPIEPSAQQIWVTEPIEWVKNNMPVIIFGDEGIGFHMETGGLLSGYNKPYQKVESSLPEIDLDWEILHCEKAVERIPSLYERQIVSRWAGFYETTADDLPIVGPCGPSGMYCIAGFNGHGLMQGLACGNLLSKMITGKPIDIDTSSLSFYRFCNNGSVKNEKYKI